MDNRLIIIFHFSYGILQFHNNRIAITKILLYYWNVMKKEWRVQSMHMEFKHM